MRQCFVGGLARGHPPVRQFPVGIYSLSTLSFFLLVLLRRRAVSDDRSVCLVGRQAADNVLVHVSDCIVRRRNTHPFFCDVDALPLVLYRKHAVRHPDKCSLITIYQVCPASTAGNDLLSKIHHCFSFLLFFFFF